MSTALMTHAHKFTVQPYDVNGNLNGITVSLQTRKVSPKKTRSKIDGTNALSKGKAEWFPGVLVTHVPIAGIVDATNSFDIIFSDLLDNAFYAEAIFYIVEAIAGAGANDPLRYKSKVLFTDAEMDWEVDSNGNLGKFNAECWVIGPFVKLGSDVTAAKAVGFQGS